jgi:sodium-dependent dicarboxylate transporter 2/3/5
LAAVGQPVSVCQQRSTSGTPLRLEPLGSTCRIRGVSQPARFRDLAEARGTLSPAELRFERARRTLGLAAGPLAFALLLLFPIPAPSPAGARLAAILAWVLVWWITEAVPIPVTSLLGPALAVVCGVGSAAEMFATFGDPIVLFFLGSFVVAEAMAVSGLDRRFAYAILRRPAVGASPGRLLVAFAAVAAAISAWLNNTATTAMLYPIGLSVLGALTRQAGAADPRRSRFATALLLALAYAASIGGIATPVGTAPNLIALGQLQALAGVRIPFFHWMLVATPIALAMLALLVGYLRFALPPDLPEARAGRAELALRMAPLGPLSRAERNVLLVFAATVGGWVLPGVLAIALGPDSEAFRAAQRILPESAVAILGASLLFVLPVDWRERRFTLAWSDAARIDWGTLLLFGGGLALGGAMFRTGLAQALGDGLVAWTGSDSQVALTFLFAWVALVLTETTSNTACVTMLAPIAIAAAQAAGVGPVPPAVAVAIASSMAFMLPVSTPPNAIVYGSGAVPITAMVRHGTVLDLAAALVVPSSVLLGCRLLGLS